MCKLIISLTISILNTKTAAINYAMSSTQKRNFGYNTNNYLFEGHVFSTQSKLNDYIQNRFPISTIKTNRNSGEYTINSPIKNSCFLCFLW